VVELSTTIAPNEILLALILIAGDAAFNCSTVDFVVLPVVAVKVADCAVLTAATFAVNVAVVAAAGTVTDAGTVTELLELASATVRPPVGAEPERLTLQESLSDPVIEALPQLTELTVGATDVPVPLRLTTAAAALLDMESCPVTELAAVG